MVEVSNACCERDSDRTREHGGFGSACERRGSFDPLLRFSH